MPQVYVCVSYRCCLSRIKAGIPFCVYVCVPVLICITGQSWWVADLAADPSSPHPPALTHSYIHIHSHDATPPPTKRWLYIPAPALVPGFNGGGPCTTSKQENINGEISLQSDNSCPTHTQRWPTLVVLFPMFFEVWNWAQMLNKAMGTGRWCVCVCVCVCRAEIFLPGTIHARFETTVSVSHVFIALMFTQNQC